MMLNERTLMKMKKIIGLMLVLVLMLLVSCSGGTAHTTHSDADNNGACDVCGEAIEAADDECTSHTDADNDSKCDACGEALKADKVECITHVDADANYRCDVCGTVIKAECPGHNDLTGDGRCDICGTDVEPEQVVCTKHKDLARNGKCDVCGATVAVEEESCTSHTDVNTDGKCDVCGATVEITVTCNHVDADDNGKCDECDVSIVIILDFYAINDLHGKFADTDADIGVDELTTYLMNAYETDDNTIILSSGDMWQGAPESNLTKGLIITDWLNYLDIVSMTLGNHEFDWNSDYVRENAALAEFPLLAINIYENATGKLASYCQPSVMVERSGVKIGIIGAIGDCYSSISSSMVTDVHFKTGSALTALVKAEADKLRAQGAELIVYSLHDGYGDSSYGAAINMSASAMSAYYDTALSNGYVDIVFEGHSHQQYIHIDNYGVYHMQGGGDNDGVSHIEITLNIITDSFTVNTAEIVRGYQYSSLPDDPIVETLLDKYDHIISEASEYLGKNKTTRNSSFLKDLVSQLYYEIGMETWGDEYDIALGGGFMSVRSPYYLYAGDVVYGDLLSLLPFNNDIVLCSISGYKLKQCFFETDNTNYYITYGEYGASIKNNIKDNAIYYIVTDRYTLDYSWNGLTYVDTLGPDLYARDLVAEYIKAGNLS